MNRFKLNLMLEKLHQTRFRIYNQLNRSNDFWKNLEKALPLTIEEQERIHNEADFYDPTDPN